LNEERKKRVVDRLKEEAKTSKGQQNSAKRLVLKKFYFMQSIIILLYNLI
jgi:hypothetical protein